MHNVIQQLQTFSHRRLTISCEGIRILIYTASITCCEYADAGAIVVFAVVRPIFRQIICSQNQLMDLIYPVVQGSDVLASFGDALQSMSALRIPMYSVFHGSDCPRRTGGCNCNIFRPRKITQLNFGSVKVCPIQSRCVNFNCNSAGVTQS